MSLRLYKVTCKGMTTNVTGTVHGIAYVLACNPTEAYEIVRKDLDVRDLGFRHEREMDIIELIAEDVPYPDCRIRLYISENFHK